MINYHNAYSILSVLLISIMSCAQSKKQIIPQTYVAYKTSETIVIDGKADEDAWKSAKWTTDFTDIEGDKTPKYQTNIKMLWDDNYYYILADIKEPHIWATLKQRDTIIFYNNDFEVFIDPDGDTHNYYELEINALNTAWDLFLNMPYRESGNIVLNDWDMTGLKSAVQINGTLNNPNDIDEGWVLEIAIPFKELKTGVRLNNIPKDQFWRVNFSRVNWDFDLTNGKYSRKKGKDGKFLPEYNWVWSPQGVINMHEPEKWGYVYFSSQEAGSNVTFAIPQDDRIKWKLYEFHRAQRTYFEKYNRWATTIKDLQIAPFVIDGKPLNPVIETHSLGWNITMESPFSGSILSIRQDGLFLSKKK